MWVMKRVAVVGAMLLVLLSLTGCVAWFYQSYVAEDASSEDVAEGPLREQIGDLASVVEVASSVDDMFGRTVWVSVSELVESDLQAIVASADELLAGGDVTFNIAFEGHNLLVIVYPNEFSAEELASEVDYWLALSSANKAPLGILLQASASGRYRNIWDPDETDILDWDALRAVPDPSTADHSYYLDDIVAHISMPTPDVIAFRDRLVAVELGDDESVSLDYVTPVFVFVRYVSPEAGSSDPAAMASWPRVREIVSELAALGLPQSNFVFNVEGYASGADLYLGACADVDEEEPNWASAELVDALTSSGLEFPLGVSVGFCNDPYPYE
jgi:hypothetical protein